MRELRDVVHQREQLPLPVHLPAQHVGQQHDFEQHGRREGTGADLIVVEARVEGAQVVEWEGVLLLRGQLALCPHELLGFEHPVFLDAVPDVGGPKAVVGR